MTVLTKQYGQWLDPGGWTELGVLVNVENGLRTEAFLTTRSGRMRQIITTTCRNMQ